ncbi:uncharacterized protein PAC_12990 [Phialocephala subalpina]|uniref:FAD-binding PCMH-type domain-containing protein n=1 Tax=Phialocephala subalpina TaxID=576137 RepID=A0A1L7XDK1_9HELO|nr:uncharacterized protein PAC_12990 [Phialocephala subalpina]
MVVGSFGAAVTSNALTRPTTTDYDHSVAATEVPSGPLSPNINMCMTACIQLEVAFLLAGKQIVSGIGGTSILTSNYWAAQQGAYVPACVITPASAADVLAIVKQAETWQCQFSTKSGGHVPFAGASNIQGGILIDLSSVNEITLSSDKTSAVVGSGQRWANVYAKLNALGLSALGTHTADVGVGGSLLGGGISPLANQHGWGCDNVLSYEVVIGDQILTVTPTSYSDLYFALRGGGNNFGIVTRFTIAVYPLELMWGGSYIYQMAEFAPVIDVMTNFTAQSDSDPKGIATTFLDYTAPVVNPPILANFTAPPHTASTMQVQTEASITTSIPSPWGFQQTFWTFTYKANNALPHNIWVQCEQNVDAFLAQHPVAGFQLGCIFVPVIPTLIKNSNKNGGNAMGLTTDSALMMFLLQITWNNAADQPYVYQFAQAFITEANATAHSMGVNHPYVHLNYAHISQNPFFGYGPTNLAKLRAVSKKYDPQQTFQKLQPGGFKL